MRTSLGIVALLALIACAPTVDGPSERQRAIDREDGTALTAQLAQLPGVVTASATLRRVVPDPLTPSSRTSATAAILVVVDDAADLAATRTAAAQLAHAAAPEIAAPAIVVTVGAHRPTLARVGPFTVEASSRGPLRAALAIALALIAGLAAWIAVRYRRGNSAQ